MTTRSILRLIGALGACAAACGCADALKAPYPAKTYFLVDPGRPAGTARAAGAAPTTGISDPPLPKRLNGDLTVRQFQVAAPYDGSAFVYKVGPNQFSSDYYSAFLLTTGRMLGDGTRDWLNRSNLFAHVIDANSGVRTRYILEANVNGLYADYTDRHKPVAVVEVQFFLLGDADAGAAILFARSYSTSAPITGSGPASVVNAWNHALRSLLEELTTELATNSPSTFPASTLQDATARDPRE